MVIVIIAVLVGLLLPVLPRSRENAKARQKEIEEEALVSAIRNYRLETLRWPVPPSGDGTYETNNAAVINLLDEEGKVVRYLNRSTFHTDAGGNIKDPYGAYYRLTVTETNAWVNDRKVGW